MRRIVFPWGRYRRRTVYQTTCTSVEDALELELNEFGWTMRPPATPEVYIDWGRRRGTAGKRCVTETGFWAGAYHIDTQDLYGRSTLNTPEARQEIESYRAPMSAHDVVFGADMRPTKYRQRPTAPEWRGVVLALQRPKDRSITATGGDYVRFVRAACEKWRGELLLKEHPQGGSFAATWRQFAAEFGCTCVKCHTAVIDQCRFVVVFNSTFAVDALLRGKNVMQYAPGYLMDTGAVTYTGGTLWDSVPDRLVESQRVLDFLVWRYCFWAGMSLRDWARTLVAHAQSDAMFPLPEDLSWAATVPRRAKEAVA